MTLIHGPVLRHSLPTTTTNSNQQQQHTPCPRDLLPPPSIQSKPRAIIIFITIPSLQHPRAHLYRPAPAYLPNQQVMSYADVAASGPQQTPEEAAAPQPPSVVTNESTSTASLIDVDVPSVHTVASDFMDQVVKTETQAQRLEREAAAKLTKARSDAESRAAKADSWLTAQFSKLSDRSIDAIAVANLAGIIGLSSFLGWKAWGLYENGRLSWQGVGIGAGILAAVGAAETFVGRYLYKGRKSASS